MTRWAMLRIADLKYWSDYGVTGGEKMEIPQTRRGPRTGNESDGWVDSETASHWDPPGHEKMSHVLMDFVSPYTRSARSDEDFRKLVAKGAFV
jgi:hypothetical protein